MNLRAWLELMRLSNAPTCVTNVIVGAALMRQVHGGGDWLDVGIIAFGVVILYAGGMAMNDLVDARIDKEERPNRPIPSGRISPRAAAIFVTTTFIVGLALFAIVSMRAFQIGIGLVAAVALYDLIHKQTAWSVLVMGACRSLVYIVAAAAIVGPFEWSTLGACAGAMGLYIVVLTFIARVESRGGVGPRGGLILLLPLIALAPLAALQPDAWLAPILAAIGMSLWVLSSVRFVRRTPPFIPGAIMTQLAGICLVDAVWLAALNDLVGLAVALACFIVTVIGHTRIAGS